MATKAVILYACVILTFKNACLGQHFTPLCDIRTMTLRAGYNEHPSDCSKYVQCLLNTEGKLVGIERDCGYGTYWNQNFLTCILATDTDCKHDLCYGIQDGLQRKGVGNCRGFWECRDNQSVPLCCPLGQNFNVKHGCVPNAKGETCIDNCFDKIAVANPNDTFTGETSSFDVRGRNDIGLNDRLFGNNRPDITNILNGGASSSNQKVKSDQRGEKQNSNSWRNRNTPGKTTNDITSNGAWILVPNTNQGAPTNAWPVTHTLSTANGWVLVPASNEGTKNTNTAAPKNNGIQSSDASGRINWVSPNADKFVEDISNNQVDLSNRGGTGKTNNKKQSRNVDRPTADASDKTLCDKKVIKGEPGMYMHILYGGGWKIPRLCPTGTMFVQSVCNCLPSWAEPTLPEQASSAQAAKETTCTPIIHLPFTTDERDEYGNDFNITNENVTIENGVAKFNGYDSRLGIPSFPYVDITSSLVIKVVYTSNHVTIPMNLQRTLFSNDGCNEEPSIFMYENARYILSGVGTLNKPVVTARIPQASAKPGQRGLSTDKEAMYMFHEDEFTIKERNRSRTISAEGNLRLIPCPLYIGYGADMLPFKGKIDEFTIYMCNVMKPV